MDKLVHDDDRVGVNTVSPLLVVVAEVHVHEPLSVGDCTVREPSRTPRWRNACTIRESAASSPRRLCDKKIQ